MTNIRYDSEKENIKPFKGGKTVGEKYQGKGKLVADGQWTKWKAKTL